MPLFESEWQVRDAPASCQDGMSKSLTRRTNHYQVIPVVCPIGTSHGTHSYLLQIILSLHSVGIVLNKHFVLARQWQEVNCHQA